MNTTAMGGFERAYESRIFDAVTPFVGRVLLSAIFLASSVGKLQAPADAISYIASGGLPFPPLAYAAAVLIELVGGITLIVGFRTRITAAALAMFSLATAVDFHNNLADLNQFIQFFKNVAMAGGLLQIVVFGAGAFSLDAYRGRRK